MLRIERSRNGEEVRLAISGRVEAEHLEELQRLIDDEPAPPRRIVLDLREVKLVDRDAVSFFARCDGAGVKLENCPGYVREWIGREAERPGRHEIARRGRRKTPIE